MLTPYGCPGTSTLASSGRHKTRVATQTEFPIMQAMTLITFLRGVNVGGHRTFRPSILANQLKHYGVVNIGAAGTFVIRKPVSQARLRSELLRRLPFDAEVIMCTGQELIAAASANPFDGEPVRTDIVRFVSVLAKRPQVLPSMPIRLPRDGKWLLRILSTHSKFVFGVYRREMKAISCLSAIDKLFGVPVTTRNWNTISAILKVLEKEQKRPCLPTFGTKPGS